MDIDDPDVPDHHESDMDTAEEDSDAYDTDTEKVASQKPEPSASSNKKTGLGKNIKQRKPKVFNRMWLTLPEFKLWLKPGDTSTTAKCDVCKVQLKAGKTELQKHGKTIIHRKKLDAFLNAEQDGSVKTFIFQGKKMADLESAVYVFIVENNLPLSLAPSLVEFLKKFPDRDTVSKITLGKQKATNVIRQGLWPSFSNSLIEDLKENSFSDIIDETTDKSGTKQLAILIMYFDARTFEMKVDLLDLVACPVGTAQVIYDTMIATMKKYVPFERWIGFCSDTPATMTGQWNSVQKIRQNFPHVHIVNCSCHMIHLCASHACKTLPNSLEDLRRTIHTQFSRSAKNSEAFKEFQEFFHAEPHRLLKPCQTRRLSLHSCVSRILEQWEPLKAYWTLLAHEDPTHANTLTLSTLRNPLQKSLLLFLQYVLGLLTDFNVIFQAESPMFHLLKGKVTELLKTLCGNIYKVAYVRSIPDILSVKELDANIHVPLSQVYLGVDADDLLRNLLAENPNDEKLAKEVDNVRGLAKKFYLEAISQIQTRFRLESDLYRDASFMSVDNARNREPSSVAFIGRKYVGSFVSVAQLDQEWRTQSLLEVEVTADETDSVHYWKKVLALKNANGDLKFPNLKILIYFLTLPFSDAAVERIFSILKNVKTETRNRLADETLAGILCVKLWLKRMGLNFVEVLIGNGPLYKCVSNATANESKALREEKLSKSKTTGT